MSSDQLTTGTSGLEQNFHNSHIFYNPHGTAPPGAMKILSRNARGLENPRGIRTLCDPVKWEGPEIVFLQETKLSTREFESCKYKLCFQNCLAISSSGRNGDIALLWGANVELSVINYSATHIDVAVKESNLNMGHWFLIAVNGFHEIHLRHNTWNLLRSLCRINGEHLLVMGDFNELMCHHEKRGGKSRLERKLSTFREVIEDCNLRDLGF